MATDDTPLVCVTGAKGFVASSTLERNPYYLSKTLAERAAWDFMAAEEPAFDLVAINPSVVMGPSLSPAINASNQILVDLLSGAYPAILSLSRPRSLARQPDSTARVASTARRHGQLPSDAHRPDAPVRHHESGA